MIIVSIVVVVIIIIIIIIIIICYVYAGIYNYVSENTNFIGHVQLHQYCVYDLCYLPSTCAMSNVVPFRYVAQVYSE